MTLHDKIVQIYPTLTDKDFVETIMIQDNLDGKGDFIAKWNHPTFTQPTQAQLDAIN